MQSHNKKHDAKHANTFSIGQGGQKTMQKSKTLVNRQVKNQNSKKQNCMIGEKKKGISCNKKDKNSISSQSAKKTSIRNRISKEQRQVVWSS